MPFCATPHARTLHIATLRKAVCVYFFSMIAMVSWHVLCFWFTVLCVVVCCVLLCVCCVQGSITYQVPSAGLTCISHSEKQVTNWTLCIPWMESGSDMT